jgi:hypothetical protein
MTPCESRVSPVACGSQGHSRTQAELLGGRHFEHGEVSALDPQTVQERVLVDWLRQALDLAHLERLAVMVERARRDVWPR